MISKFINYYSEYSNTLSSKPVKQYGKFVVLINKDYRYLIFAAIEQAEFHANIVERYMNSQNLNGKYNKNKDMYNIQESDWQVQGGGHWEYQSETHVLTLFGKSLAYGQAELEWVATQLQEIEAFDEARISCRH